MFGGRELSTQLQWLCAVSEEVSAGTEGGEEGGR